MVHFQTPQDKDKVDQLDFKGIEFIMKLRDVDIFESKNP